MVGLLGHGPFTKHLKLRVMHAPRMLGPFSDPDMRHARALMHARIVN